MEKHCKAPFGYAQLADVYDTHTKGEDRWVDMQESFWAAETLKFLWLTFSDVDSGEASFTAQPSTAGTYGSFTLHIVEDRSWIAGCSVLKAIRSA